jgi:hypothetical protein
VLLRGDGLLSRESLALCLQGFGQT